MPANATAARPHRSEAPASVHPLMGELIEKVQRINEIVAAMTGTGSTGSATVTKGTVTVKAAMARMSIGRTKLNELINDGVIAKIKCGRKTLLSLSDIDRYLNESVVPA